MAVASDSRACRVLTGGEVDEFQRLVYRACRSHHRSMPWREIDDPYRILVSEVMLQQTRVERVLTKYPLFLATFPTPEDLANAPLAQVLQAWQGLGYNRRAVALQRCARELVSRFGGHLPAAVPDLESLPGIGRYTARAVAAFAFGSAEALIETNIRSVFIHHFFQDSQQVTDREIEPLVQATVDLKNPRDWFYALMDYGVILKRSHPNPSRRSAHHTRQTPFKGSNRELRSRILRAIMAGAARVEELAALLPAGEDALQRNLAALQREGFIVSRSEGFAVSGDDPA